MSSDLIASRSAATISRIMSRIGTLGDLVSEFGKIGYKGSIQSCFATANLIFDVANDNTYVGAVMTVHQPPSKVQKFFGGRGTTIPMSPTQVVDDIMRLLGLPKVVFISVAPDHHFCVLPMDDTRIAMLQGFQGSYTLADWLGWCGLGSLTKASFKDAMLELLTSGSPAAWTAGAVKLFSFESGRPPKDTVLTKEKIKSDIEGWFRVTKPFVKGYYHKDM